MKRKGFYIFVFLIILLPDYKAYNQKVIYPEFAAIFPRFQQFHIPDEKGGTVVTYVFIDRKGFIWCGMETGLYRFDGRKYDGFASGTSDSSIYGSVVLSILEDSEGTIWAGTYSALNSVDIYTGKVKHFFPDTTDFAGENNSITCINEDKNGKLWLITKKDIFSFNRKTEVFTRHPIDSSAWNLPQSPINFETERFFEDDKGRIWIATNDGLYAYSDSTWKKSWPGKEEHGNYLNHRVSCVKGDSKGNIWFGTDNYGLLKITDPEGPVDEKIIFPGQMNNQPANSKVSAIFCEESGSIWLFGNSVLTLYNPSEFTSKSYYFSDQNIPRYKWGNTLNIDKIFIGKSESLMLTELGSGLMFHFIPGTEKLTLHKVPNWIDFNLLQDKTGNFWVAAINSNIFRLMTDSVPYVIKNVEHYGGPDMIDRSRLAEDEQGILWLALRSGIYRIKPADLDSEIPPEKFAFPFRDLIASSVFCDTKGDIWFGCNKGTVIKYSRSAKRFLKYNVPSESCIYNFDIAIIAEDRKGGLWFADPFNGIFNLKQGANRIEKFLAFTELPGNLQEANLWDFMIDESDELWILTTYGIFRTDSKKSKIYDLSGADGTGKKYWDWYVRIMEDNEGNIIAMNMLKGLSGFDRVKGSLTPLGISNASPGAYYCDMNIDKRGRFLIVRNKTVEIIGSGMKNPRELFFNNLFSDVQSLTLSSGEMLVLSGNQLIKFPEEVPFNRNIPPVYITQIYVNDTELNRMFPGETPVTDLRSIDLKFMQNYLKIGFAALDYMQPERNRYRYYMKGMDRDTVENTASQVVEYKNMKPGRYSFWVTGSNNDGFWNLKGVTLAIRIHPPLYRSTMAYIIYFLAFAILIAIYIRLRTSRLLKEKIRLEAEVSQRTSELKVKNLQLEESDKTKTRFFTNISHEIRTPLSMILAPLDKLISEHGDDEKKGSVFELMKRNGQRLMQLVNQLLDISRLDSGKMKIILSETDVVKNIRILVYEFLSIAESKNIRYLVEVPDKKFISWLDIDKTEKIISNLLSNAFKFTPAGGTVTCKIRIENGEGGTTGDMLEITTKDSGPGISAEHIEKIFDRFYRVENHYGKEGAGTGIGLALTQEFVSLLHGTIKVNSVLGEGSEFVVTIPLGKDRLTEEEYIVIKLDEIDRQKPHLLHNIERAHWSDESREREDKVTVLVIEDNDDLRNFIRESMAEDYNVLEAEDGKEGANLALTMIPDLIITDLMIPGMDGVSLCSLLKNDERTSHVPVIMLTAKATADERIEGLKSGADDYITKPFNMTELKVRVSNLLEQREKLRLKYRNNLIFSLSDKTSASVDDKFMEKIYNIIRENIRDFNFDSGALHEKAGMSRVHLFRKLKAITGIPPSTLIRNIRLETAARYLLSNAGNITEISNSIGISNPSYFTKCFRKYFGVSPKDYASSVKEKT